MTGLSCPRCGAEVEIAAMHVDERTVGVSFQCLPCDWLIVRPNGSTMPASQFLTLAVPAPASGDVPA